MTVKAGSEEDISPEDRWISKFIHWDLDDDVPGPSSSAPLVVDDPVHIEESEEEDASEDDSGDGDYDAEQ